MNRNVRAGGIAAAVLGLALSFVPAEPSEAGQVNASAPTATYLDHATATIDSNGAPNNTVSVDNPTGIDAQIAREFVISVLPGRWLKIAD